MATSFQEDKPEDDMLVLAGVHVGTQGVGGTPEVAFKAEIRPV
jgi:hypothetical protein